MTTRETGAATQAQDDVCRLADLYCETKDRIVGLLDDPDAAQWNRPVPACPGWSVRDVVAHLTAVALDLLDGRLTVPHQGRSVAPASFQAGTGWTRSGRICRSRLQPLQLHCSRRVFICVVAVKIKENIDSPQALPVAIRRFQVM